jgi:hypothetical protein
MVEGICWIQASAAVTKILVRNVWKKGHVALRVRITIRVEWAAKAVEVLERRRAVERV